MSSKDKEASLRRSFRVILEREEEGGYSVWVPALSGCASQGETREEALANITEAIEVYLEGLKLDGLPVPEETAEETTVEVAV